MLARLILICSAAGPSARRGVFPADDMPDDRALAGAAALKPLLRGAGRALVAPERQAAATAQALGLEIAPEKVLRDQNLGRWAGKSLDELSRTEPQTLAAWLADPAVVPGGGESFAMVMDRIARWLEDLRDQPGHTVAVTHAAVIRAAILAVIGAPAACFARIDVTPLSLTELRGDGRRWMLRATGLMAR